MPIANFEILSEGLAELAGLPKPRVKADDKGARAFCIELDGVAFSLMESDHGRPDAVYLMTELGTAPHEHDAAAQWTAMLEANTTLFGVDAPRFCRNPQSGAAVLQWLCARDRLNLTDIHLRLSRMAAVASTWMNERATPKEPAWHAPLIASTMVDDIAAAEAARELADIHADMCAVLGQPPLPMPDAELGVVLPLRFEEIEVALAHFPKLRPDAVMAVLRMSKLLPAPSASALADLMDANFFMGLQPGGPVFCLEPSTGELFKRWEFSLKGAKAQDWLERTAVLVKLAREWADFVVPTMATASTFSITQ